MAFADQHFHYLVPFAAQMFLQREGLCQVSPAFALYDEQEFHEAMNKCVDEVSWGRVAAMSV